MSAGQGPGLAVRTGLRVRADAARTVTRFFVAGQEEVGGGESRAADVMTRLLALDDSEVELAVADVMVRFGKRHDDFAEQLEAHAALVAHRLPHGVEISAARRQLIGATFTHEYSIEAAAICNPSIVALPDQHGVALGALRFAMSVRGVGEGHRSSIGFLTGEVDANGHVSLDERSPHPVIGTVGAADHDREVVRGKLREVGDDGESASFVLDRLGARFTGDDLEKALRALHTQIATRYTADETIARIRAVAATAYDVRFDPATELSQRVLWPSTAVEAHGMEDARFVRFVEDDGSVVYYATYTAFDGRHVSQQLLETADFVTFRASPIVGGVARNKGLALFPRRVHGRYVALSRWDRETNSIATSDRLGEWDRATTIQIPTRPWELMQLGNCGSPIETEAGWLVLTHGVGAMRTYSIGALLLDIDDPTRVIGALEDPLLSPTYEEQDGYVPNVVYTCGALVHGDTLVLPYGIADASIGMATVPLPALLDQLTDGRPLPGGRLPG